MHTRVQIIKTQNCVHNNNYTIAQRCIIKAMSLSQYNCDGQKPLAMVSQIAIDLGKTQISPIVNIAVDIKSRFRLAVSIA
jgi:hypothetical protein